MKRVLVVDDSPTVVQAAYDELEERGYLVDVAYNGKAALKLLTENADDLPALIVMDIEMPKMRGDEAARVIRDTPAWAFIPIVALTGRKPENIDDADSLFNRYLIKPFGFEQMIKLIEEMIGAPD
jgi:CheY-like chemotaxis protein